MFETHDSRTNRLAEAQQLSVDVSSQPPVPSIATDTFSDIAAAYHLDQRHD